MKNILQYAALLAVAAFVALFPCFAFGQAATAALNGTVVDSSGAAVAGAHVSVMNLDTKTMQVSTTNDSGRYVFPALNPARYSLQVEKPGFQTATVVSFILAVNQTLTEDVNLVVGASTQQVTVRASEVNLEPPQWSWERPFRVMRCGGCPSTAETLHNCST
jgi:hypothetical protein